MTSFRSGQNIQDLEGKNNILNQAERVDTLSAEDQQKHLKIFEKSFPLEDEVINLFYSYIRYFSQLQVKVQTKVIQLLCRILKDLFQSESRNDEDREEPDESENIERKRDKIKFYVYFLVFLIRDQEKRECEVGSVSSLKKKKKKAEEDNAENEEDDQRHEEAEEPETTKKSSASSNWSNEREKCLEALLGVLIVPASKQSTDLGRIFDSAVPDDSFLNLFSKVGETVLERGLTVVRSGSKTRELAFSLIVVPTHLFHDLVSNGVAAMLWNFIRQHAFGSQLVVELLVLSSEKFKEERLAAELIQQLGDEENTTHKNIALFVEQLGKAFPLLLKNNLSLLLPYLNQKESYQMRCAILRSLAYLMEYLHENKQQGGTSNNNSSNTTVAKILDTLTDYAHDVSPYVRAAVAQAWNHLVETKTLPLSHLLVALSVALDGTRDKKVLVRKQSLLFVENLLAQNCFGPDLRIPSFVTEVEVRKEELEGLMNQSDSAESENEETDAPMTEEEEARDKRKRVLMESLTFLKTALLFIAKLENAISYLCHLLSSKTDDDVLGVIRFFATAKRFKLAGAERGVRAMLKLIWSADSDKVKKVLMETVESLYIARTESTKRFLFPSEVIASNLVELAQGANQDELTSLAEVVSEMRRGGEASCLKRTILPQNAVEELWPIILGHNFSRARVALCVLGMAAATSPEVVDKAPSSSKLIQAAFNGQARERRDFEFAKLAFQVLMTACKARKGQCMLEREERELIEKEGIHLICGKWHIELQQEREQWFGATQSALDLICEVSTSPEKTLMFIVEHLFEMSRIKHHVNINALCDLFFVSGHVAVKLLVLAERLAQHLKRRKNMVPVNSKSNKQEEEEMLGASAEDETEDLLVRQIAEQDLFQPHSIFRLVCDWSSKLVLNQQSSMQLRQCAVMALCKFMSVSERVCEDHLALVFTVLRDEREPEIRSLIVISLGDLAFRFPNAVEPYTSEMYKALRDEQTLVRKNALMVLTHLALNDMIKVRGEVSEIAMRLEDEDSSTKDLARFFFAEIAKRGTNPIYNLLPDILGSLSRESPQVLGPNKFRSLAKFLLEFVDKEKQCESLAEKLCHRIHTTCGSVSDMVVPSQLKEFSICRDLVFCLEQLKCSESLLKRLNDDSDLFKCLLPILGDKEVFVSLSKWVNKCSPKNQEGKRALDEIVDKFNTLHTSQSADIASFEKANSRSKAKLAPLNEGNINALMEDGEQETKDKKLLQASLAGKKKRAPPAASKKKPAAVKKKVTATHDSDDNDDEDEAPPVKKPIRSKQRVVQSDSEEES